MWTDILLLMRTEMMLVVIIFLLLFWKLGGGGRVQVVQAVVNGGLLLTLLLGFVLSESGELFGHMFRTNDLLRLEKNMLVLGALLVSLLASQWVAAHRHAMEFYLLMISTLLGMCFMLSSANLLMFYLGLELASIPLAAMVNFDLQRKQSAEAAFKMIVSSAFASGILLFGISWLYGTTGTVDFDSLATALTGSPLQVLGVVAVLAGFGFKMSAVPFHLWTADVYEGAPVPVTAYLSVLSKSAILFVFVSVLYTVFGSMEQVWYIVICVLAIGSMLVGNLFAMRQQNMKRFLAFSSIAQVGFILVGICGVNATSSAAVVFFLLVYLFSNLGAFAIVQHIGQSTGRETIDDYRGLAKANPALAWLLAIALFSLAGIPPTAGFFGKFFLLLAGAGKGTWFLIVVAALNMIVSLYYYLRVVKAMFMETQASPIERIPLPLSAKIALAICVGGIFVTGLFGGAYEYIFSLMRQ